LKQHGENLSLGRGKCLRDLTGGGRGEKKRGGKGDDGKIRGRINKKNAKAEQKIKKRKARKKERAEKRRGVVGHWKQRESGWSETSFSNNFQKNR